MKFRKITALAGSVLMTGLTVATAAAATYPAPFVENGVADAAIVYGTGTGVSSTDFAQAGNVQSSLSTFVDSDSTTTVEGGESFKLEKSSDRFNFGDDLNTIYQTLDDDELDFLADGVYDEGDNEDIDYEQTITLGSKTLELFADKDYENKEPTIGFHFDDDLILEYTVEFDDSVNLTAMKGEDFPLMGKTYYVSDADENEIVLLDTAEEYILDRGETMTIDGKEFTVEFLDDDEARFTVDGVSTGSIKEGEEYELEDDSYLIVTDVLTSAKDSVTDRVEFSVGSGKMVLPADDTVELNDDTVDGLEVTYDVTGTGSDAVFDSLTLTWNADDEEFLTEENSLVMPIFEEMKVIFGGLDFPEEPETISFAPGELFSVDMENYDLPLIEYENSVYTLGEYEYDLIIENSTVNYTDAGFDETTNNTGFWFSDEINNSNDTSLNETTEIMADGLSLSEDNRFLVTRVKDEEFDTLYYEVTTLDVTKDEMVVLEDLIGNDDLEFDSVGDNDEVGEVTVTLKGFSQDNKTAYFSFTSDDDVAYNRIISDKGMQIEIPAYENDLETDLGVGFNLTVTEADEDGNIGAGDGTFTVVVKYDSDDDIHVADVEGVDSEEESDDLYVGYVESELATKTTEDTDAKSLEVEYYGQEVTADVQVVAGGEVSTSTTGALGDVIVKDSEVSTVNANNLVIVGGSCINSAAATVLGGNYCGESFTAATGVATNEFLIKGIEDSAIDGKFALVVAGYEAADTANAVTYLTNKDVDTSKTYKGTSATSAEVMVA